MKTHYFKIKDGRCQCDCDGEGEIILLRCIECNSLIGGCSELDFNSYLFTKSGEKILLEGKDNPYGCPSCHSESNKIRYATIHESHPLRSQIESVFI